MRRFMSVTCVAAAWALLIWPGGARAENVTLQFLYTQPTPTWGPVMAEFEKRNPDIHVQGQQVPFDALNAQVTARIGAHDSSIDVFGCDEPRVPAFARRGYLLDLSDLRPDFEKAVSQKAIGSVSADNKLWSFPLWTSTQVMFYNKDLLAKAALPVPSADPKARTTWETLLEQAAKAQQAGAKWGFTFDQVDRYYELEPLYVSSGAGLGLGGENMLSPQVDTPAWVRTTDWYGKLYSSGIAPRGIPPEQTAPLFASGQVAYMVAGPWNLALLTQAKGLSFGMAAMPYFDGGKAVTPTDSWSIAVSPYSQHRDAAIKFARFMTLDNDGALLSTAALPLPPANKAAFDAFLKRQTAAGGEVTQGYETLVRYELENTAVSRPRSVGYVAFEEIMNRTFSDVRNGAQAGPALQTAQTALSRALARMQ